MKEDESKFKTEAEESFHLVEKTLEEIDKDFIIQSLKQNFLFCNLCKAEFDKILAHMFFAKVT